jgi:hypothetical protein
MCRNRNPAGLGCHIYLNPIERRILFDDGKGIFHEVSEATFLKAPLIHMIENV